MKVTIIGTIEHSGGEDEVKVKIDTPYHQDSYRFKLQARKALKNKAKEKYTGVDVKRYRVIDQPK